MNRLMDVRCDTWKECPIESCPHITAHQWGSAGKHKCEADKCYEADCRVRCDSVVSTCSVCGAEKEHWRVSEFTRRVRELHNTPAPKMETHTCYFCDHTGQDVNRIATPISRFKERQTVYCCDDGYACDERWQALQENDLEQLQAQWDAWRK